ncbi:MAG: hypothetical protein ABI852_14265 [Gemmatimonadaceae bacterium]
MMRTNSNIPGTSVRTISAIAALVCVPMISVAQVAPPAPPPVRAPAASQPPAGAPQTGTPQTGTPQTGTPSTSGNGANPAAANSAIPVPLVGPAIRRIETAQFVSTEVLGSITTVRHLPDGRILLNDGTRRRLLLMDSTLKTVGIVLDSLTDVQNAYGTRAGSLIPYRGDSTLFVDPATYAMLVIDSKGTIVRVRSVPRAQDASYIAQQSTLWPVPGFDGAGRLVYRIPAQAAPMPRPSGDIPFFPSQPDSAFVVGINLDTRKLDTLGAVKVQRSVMSFVRSEYGFDVRSTTVPLPLLDDFAVLPDGTVAFVRGRDFRIDYRAPDGTITSSEKLAFPWVRMSEDDKTRFSDSVKAVLVKNAQRGFLQEMIVWSNVLNKPYPASFKLIEGLDVPVGLPKDWILPAGMKFPANYVYACPPSVPGAPTAPVAPPAAAGAAPGGSSVAPRCVQNEYANWYGSGYTPPPPTYRAPTLIPASELPDYRPPISAGSVRADMDGNLWIRTIQMKAMPGGTIYDVVNRKGELNDRIQLPVGYTLTGFGPGKVVYLTMRDATGLHLARVRLR